MQEYEYHQNGMYFVTICTHNKNAVWRYCRGVPGWAPAVLNIETHRLKGIYHTQQIWKVEYFVDTEKILQLKQWISDSDNIVFFGGAGVSTESGLPDFRSESGIFSAISEYGYRPETILSHTFFERNPEVFFTYYKKSLLYPDAMPNDCHKALAKLDEMGKLQAVITQNIDDLHQKAGSKEVLELHGTLYRNYCLHCGKKFSLEYVMQDAGTTRCDACGGVVRPDVVLYEEGLPQNVLMKAVEYIRKADVLIVVEPV